MSYINRSEKGENRKTLLFLVNHDLVIANFRLELLERIISEGHRVVISVPFGNNISTFKRIGCECENIEMNRHGMNPLEELKILVTYWKLMRKIKPDMVFTYTIKPNVYGGIVCQALKIPYVSNVTGLGTAIENGGFKQKFVLFLYKLGVKGAKKVFFQNESNQLFMLKHGVIGKSYALLPGSGVNLEKHKLEEYPTQNDNGELCFLVIGRIMKDKGTDEILYAIRKIRQENVNVKFRFLGFYDGDYQEKINTAVLEGIIEYCGQVEDVHSYIKESHATLHASYHEGMANVLLESAACGRPVIATNVPGCKETFDDGVSGISCVPRDGESLVAAIRKFIDLPYAEKIEMGLAGRKKMEAEFDRNIIIEKYMEVINEQ